MPKKKRMRNKKPKHGKAKRLLARLAQGATRRGEPNLSVLIKGMAESLLTTPHDIPSEPASQAVLLLASAAWNSAVGNDFARDQHREAVDQIDWGEVTPWAELRSDDTEQLIAELVEYKQEHYSHDLRCIVSTEMTPRGTVRVEWNEPESVVIAKPVAASNRVAATRVERGRPIADKLVRKMKNSARGKVIDFEAVVAGRAEAEDLRKTVVTRDELTHHHPAHAPYVFAQNQVSVMSEQLTALKEMARFVKIIDKAEEEYMPSGPPMSPLTPSFFTCWAFFDACVGQAEETIGTTAMTVGAAFGMHSELVRVIGLMQQSRMGVYRHEGTEKDTVVLRELVTDTVCRAIVPAGYRGRKGELWYVRVLPPPLPGGTEHVVFTTPYLLAYPGEREWQAYFRRTLPDAPLPERIAAYEHHMKFGPTRDYWTEFVFEAYVNHRTEVILLGGLPDVAESRPHSEINS